MMRKRTECDEEPIDRVFVCGRLRWNGQHSSDRALPGEGVHGAAGLRQQGVPGRHLSVTYTVFPTGFMETVVGGPLTLWGSGERGGGTRGLLIAANPKQISERVIDALSMDTLRASHLKIIITISF